MTDQRRNDMMELYEGKEPFVFISYSHKNLDKIMPVIDWFKDNHFRIWYDNGIHPGTDWPDVVAGRLNDCAVFLAFVSSEYIASQNCTRELHFAVAKRKQLLTIYLDDAEVPLGVEMQLCTSQAIRMHDYKGKTFYQVLSNADVLFSCKEETEEERTAQAESSVKTELASSETNTPAKQTEEPVKKVREKTDKSEKTQVNTEKKLIKIALGVGIVIVALVLLLVFKTSSNVTIAGNKYPKNSSSLKLKNVVLLSSDLDKIAKLKQLAYFTLTDCKVWGDIGEPLVNCPKLVSLNLSNVEGVESLEFINELNLRYLLLDNLNLNDSSLSVLNEQANITELTISNNSQITNDNFTALFPNLFKLDLSNNSISETDDIAGLKKLKELNLENNRLTAIDNALASLEINSLSLSGNKIRSTEGLGNLTILKNFTFADNQGNDYVQGSLDFLVKSRETLKQVDLSGNGIDYAAMNALLNKCVLTTAVISNNPLGVNGGYADLEFLKNSPIEILHAENCGLTSISGLIAVGGRLQKVYLSDNNISSVSGLANLGHNGILDLRNNQLTKCSNIPKGEYSYLLLNGNPFNEFDLKNVKADYFSIDYGENMLYDFADEVTYKVYVAKVPMDKRVAFQNKSSRTIAFGTIDLEGNVIED